MANKPGKYAAFRSLYPKVPLDATVFDKRREVLDAPSGDGAMRVRDLANTDLKDLYVAARKRKDNIQSELSVVQTQIDALETLFHNRMEEDDVTSLPFTDGTTLRTSIEPYASVKDKEALHGWIRATEQEELLTLSWQTLNSITKQRLLEGESVPPGVDVYIKETLFASGLNKSKGENNE
jgi:hypothetical protein